MARRHGLCGVVLTALLAAILLPAFLSAVPVGQKNNGPSLQERSAAAANHRRLIRNRRNISWYNQHSDFWAWYKYFTDNNNQEAVQELDRIYLAYLQNKNRAEGRRSYKAYLRHLGDIYKSCADSDDPTCVSGYTARPKAKPEPLKLIKAAPIKTCDPTKDPYCLYMALVQGKSPYMPLVMPVKAPAPMYVRAAAPAKGPESGHYYYAPSAASFLSKEQKAELLRICSAEDVECLQYHLRAAYGHTPAAKSLPSYAHLGCDPKKDPGCKPKLVQKAPSGMYLQYPNCDPARDPYCAYAASLMAPRAPKPPAPAGPGSCNPLYEDGCNPLTATRFASAPNSYKHDESDDAAAIRAPPSASASEQYDPSAMYRDPYANANRIPDPYAMYRQAATPAPRQAASDPYAMIRRLMSQAQLNDPYAPSMEAEAPSSPAPNPNDPFSVIRDAAAAMQRQRQHAHQHAPMQQYPFANHEEPAQAQHHPLGPPGKTKEGYDCYMGYDPECIALKKPNQPRFGGSRRSHAAPEPRGVEEDQQRYLEPANPDCDPEYDLDCRLRRYEPEQPERQHEEHHEEEPHHSIPERAPHPEPHHPEQPEQDQYETEPYQSGQDEPHSPYPSMSQNVPTLQDILRRYGDQYPDQEEHRAYAEDYRKK
ncbi:actinodin1 isoform X2 [Eucyclogobius newberryi]|uniref:actinodin1 isoform X2 n=1 Tax=Eucyclogobius newberryi TaxID=166745 RepID=UPI003B5A7428